MTSPLQRPYGQAIRVLRENTRENYCPSSSDAVTQAHDELDLVDLQWQQAYDDLEQQYQAHTKTLNDMLIREINFITKSLLNEMVDKVSTKINHEQTNHMGNFKENKSN
ncbi:hypothetical protein I4U23_010623 [Adineta vaga]|nr:hypothetical protein I4U23_010623 [Adineta vaga]